MKIKVSRGELSRNTDGINILNDKINRKITENSFLQGNHPLFREFTWLSGKVSAETQHN